MDRGSWIMDWVMAHQSPPPFLRKRTGSRMILTATRITPMRVSSYSKSELRMMKAPYIGGGGSRRQSKISFLNHYLLGRWDLPFSLLDEREGGW